MGLLLFHECSKLYSVTSMSDVDLFKQLGRFTLNKPYSLLSLCFSSRAHTVGHHIEMLAYGVGENVPQQWRHPPFNSELQLV